MNLKIRKEKKKEKILERVVRRRILLDKDLELGNLIVLEIFLMGFNIIFGVDKDFLVVVVVIEVFILIIDYCLLIILFFKD